MTQRSNRQFSYGQVGVDVDVEARAARILYDAAKATWVNRSGKLGEVRMPFDDFAALRFVRLDDLPPGTVMYGGSDGIATKAELAERTGRYTTLAYDLLAMVCDDAVIRGGEPALVKSVLDVNTLGRDEQRLPFIRQLAEGYIGAAETAGVAVINGEIAQLNDRMGRTRQFSLAWSADVTWFAHESRLLTGTAVQPGDAIVGLREEGLRCNGISLVRRLLTRQYGKQWHETVWQGERLGDTALRPSQIYSGAVVEMFGGYDLARQPRAVLHGAAHLTGGGIPEKLGRLLRVSGYGAHISDPFPPSPLMLHCQEIGGVSDYEAYRTWNMGQGMALVTAAPEAVMTVAAEHGIEGRIIGAVTEAPGIAIRSQGLQGGLLRYGE